jgi:serine/threonine-protein kinase
MRDRPRPRTPAVGDDVADKFRLVTLLSTDATGSVFAARHASLGHVVALRFLGPELVGDPVATRLFVQGARAAAALKNEHVARVVDVGVHLARMPYVVIEHPAGASLATLVRARVALPMNEAFEYLEQACAALREAHAAGIVHGGITPASIVVGPRPSGGRTVKVAGFEVAALRAPPSGKTVAADVAAIATVFDLLIRREWLGAKVRYASVDELLLRLRPTPDARPPLPVARRGL